MWLTSKGVANINIRERILLSLLKAPEIKKKRPEGQVSTINKIGKEASIGLGTVLNK